MKILAPHIGFGFARRVLAISLVAIAANASADVKVVSEVQVSINGDFRPSTVSTSYYKGDWSRVDTGNKTILTNPKLNRSVTIDHIAKTFVRTPIDVNTQAGMMMQMMGAKMTAKVTPTEEHKEIAGHQATKYLAELDIDLTLPQAGNRKVHMKMQMENWTSTDLGIDSQAGVLNSSGDMMMQSLTAFTGVEDVKKEFLKMKGFSLLNKMTSTVDAPDAPAPITMEVTFQALKVSTASISPAMFTVPPEYRNASEEDFELENQSSNLA